MRAALLALVLAACDPRTPESPSSTAAAPRPAAPGEPVPGLRVTCLRVNGVELSVAEVDQLADDVLTLYPEYTRPHARRLALTNEFFPRLALRRPHEPTWRAARDACTALDPAAPASAPWVEEGTWRDLGLRLWSHARRQALGEWSAPLELLGRWVRVRLDELRPADDPQLERLRVSLHAFPFLDVRELRPSIESAVDAARLEILAPEWAEIVPESWKYRMRGAATEPR